MTRWSDRSLGRLAWAGWWVTALTGAARVVLGVLEPDMQTRAWGVGELRAVDVLIAAATCALVGLIVLRRHPRNVVGWLLQASGLALSLPAAFSAYALVGLVVAPGSLPGADVAAALHEGMWVIGVGMLGIFLVLFFPDGRLPSPRWRPVVWLAGGTMLTLVVGIDLLPGELEEAPVPRLRNPLGVEAAQPAVAAVVAVALVLLPVWVAAAALSLALRFRTAHGIARQQIKWLASAGAVVALLVTTSVALTLPLELRENAVGGVSPTVSTPGWLAVVQEASVLATILVPVAIGVAILRYRLFDIDVVINRTLVYATLTAILATTYLVSVLVLRIALDPLTSGSDLAVAASTLAVAALFRPLRTRIQSTVDRRFYRARYDAARTLDSFAIHLRDELDLESLRHDVCRVVDDTVHPTRVSLWLRGTTR